MYSLNFNTQQYNNYNTVKTVSVVKVDKNEHVKDSKPSFMSNPEIKSYNDSSAL